MNEPLLPADSLALNNCLAFESVDSDSSIISGVMPSMFLIAVNTAGAHSITSTSSLMIRVFYSSASSPLNKSSNMHPFTCLRDGVTFVSD